MIAALGPVDEIVVKESPLNRGSWLRGTNEGLQNRMIERIS
jgi:hypothetical protein